MDPLSYVSQIAEWFDTAAQVYDKGIGDIMLMFDPRKEPEKIQQIFQQIRPKVEGPLSDAFMRIQETSAKGTPLTEDEVFKMLKDSGVKAEDVEEAKRRLDLIHQTHFPSRVENSWLKHENLTKFFQEAGFQAVRIEEVSPILGVIYAERGS